MKNNNIVLSIIAILLVAAAVVGIVALYRNIDEIFDTGEEEITKVPVESTGNTANAGTSSTDTDDDFVYGDFYVDKVNMTGFHTYSDASDPSVSVTTFFKVFECICEDSSSNCVLTIKKEDIEAVEEYGLYLKFSYDGKTWQDVSYEEGVYTAIIPNDTGVLYIGYLHKPNCTDPAYVLSDLNANFFTDPNLFKYEHSVVTEGGGLG